MIRANLKCAYEQTELWARLKSEWTGAKNIGWGLICTTLNAESKNINDKVENLNIFYFDSTWSSDAV